MLSTLYGLEGDNSTASKQPRNRIFRFNQNLASYFPACLTLRMNDADAMKNISHSKFTVSDIFATGIYFAINIQFFFYTYFRVPSSNNWLIMWKFCLHLAWNSGVIISDKCLAYKYHF